MYSVCNEHHDTCPSKLTPSGSMCGNQRVHDMRSKNFNSEISHQRPAKDCLDFKPHPVELGGRPHTSAVVLDFVRRRRRRGRTTARVMARVSSRGSSTGDLQSSVAVEKSVEKTRPRRWSEPKERHDAIPAEADATEGDCVEGAGAPARRTDHARASMRSELNFHQHLRPQGPCAVFSQRLQRCAPPSRTTWAPRLRTWTLRLLW